MRRRKETVAIALCLILMLCMGESVSFAARTGTVALEDGGYQASGSSSIGGSSASAYTQGSDPNMRVRAYGIYQFYTDSIFKDLEHLTVNYGDDGDVYHADVSFSAGTYGLSISLTSTHSFSCGYYNDSKNIYVVYP